MRIEIIGTGFNGRAPARLAMQNGYDVMLSNLRDPTTLASPMIRCRIGTAEEVAQFGDLVMIAIPFASYSAIAPQSVAGKIVLDASNYSPERDGAGVSSELVAARLVGARVVKGFNTIIEKDVEKDARPSGTPNRRALPIAADAEDAKIVVAELFDRLGFDVVDAGPLAEGWRFERGRPAHGAALDRAALRQALGAVGSELIRSA